jgi:hypothetical protein
VKAHVERFRHAWSDSIVHEAHSALIITVDGCRGLRVSEVLEDFAFVVRNPSGGLNASVLGFGDVQADDGGVGRVGRDGVIDEGVRVEGQVGHREAEELKRCCHASGLGAGEVGSVGEHLQDHVGSAATKPRRRSWWREWGRPVCL